MTGSVTWDVRTVDGRKQRRPYSDQTRFPRGAWSMADFPDRGHSSFHLREWHYRKGRIRPAALPWLSHIAFLRELRDRAMRRFPQLPHEALVMEMVMLRERRIVDDE